MRGILSALLLVLLCAAGNAQSNDFVKLESQQDNYAWWLHVEFHPADRSVRGIPVGKLRATWCKATEFRRDLFPVELATDLDPSDGLSFAVDGPFDGSRVNQIALVGAYEACDGKRGSFLLVLAWPQDGPPAITFVQDMWTPFAILRKMKSTIQVFHCMDCDYVTEFKWDKAKKRFVRLQSTF